MIVRKLNHLQFEVVLDSTRLLEQFQFMTTAKRYRYWDKTWEFYSTPAYYFDSLDYNKIIIKAGFLTYLYRNYKNLLTEKSKQLILSEIQSVSIPQFENLTRQQNSELSILTSQVRGINQSFTGSGKTEVIATLADYCVKNGEKCIILAPTDKACDEIRNRIHEKFGHECFHYYDSNCCINVFNSRGFFESGKCQIEDPFWKEVKWCIADEVEKIFSNNVEDCFFEMENCHRWYGFSATADKKEGKPISDKLCDPTIGRNLRIVKYFGFTTVYNKPSLKYIDLYEIACNRYVSLISDSKETSDDKNSDNETSQSLGSGYLSYLDIYFDEKLAKTIKRIAIKERQMFIPLSRREVLTDWLQNWWTDIPVIFINGSGYQLWNNGLIQRYLTLTEVKELISTKQVKYVFGTVSAFNALDFQGLSNVMILAYSSASMVLQSIGRVLRGNSFKIFLPYCSVNFDTQFTRDYKRRLSLILNYYNECKINRYYKTDRDYDVTKY